VDPHIPDREADLSHISVTVTTNPDGTQTVEMFIMDAALPTYTPELTAHEYYYEQLPVRLIYQVGLTEEAQDQVLALNRTGGELVFYTNQWMDEEGNEDQNRISTSVLLPSTENPFYYHIDGTEPPYKPHHSLKTEDTTHTVDYHVDCHREIEEKDGNVLVKVIHRQGNNGKLVFKADTISIPVEKQWDSGVNADIMNPVEMVVYKVSESVNALGEVIRNAEPVATVPLSVENGWKNTFQGLAAPDGTWYYAVAERVPSGYSAFYDQQTVRVTTDGSQYFDAVPYDGSGAVITVTNTPAVRLPATGGGGTLWYTLGGLLLITAALLLYSLQFKRRREEMNSL
jgi:LPXTG-motif cell wall-anchored protein